MSTLGEGTQSEILVSTGGVLYDQVAIATGGGTIEFVLPTDFHTCLIEISVQGDDLTDFASHVENLTNVLAFEIFTTEGEALRVADATGSDPYYYSWWVQQEPRGSYTVGGTAVLHENVTTYKIPLSLGISRWFNYAGEFFGLPLEIADRLRVTFGTDVQAGKIVDSRQATLQAFGLRKPRPKAFRTTIPDSYTAAVGQSHWTELPPDTRLAGVWTYHTTTWNCSTANEDLSIDEQRLAYGRTSFFKRVKTMQLQNAILGSNFGDLHSKNMINEDFYTYWSLDTGEHGAGEPNPGNLVVESVGGQAEAVRVYPIVWRLV